MNILQVSSYDTSGGAEKVAWNLFQTYRTRGHSSWLAVGHKLGQDPGVLEIPNSTSPGRFAQLGWNVHARLRAREPQGKWASWLSGLIHFSIEPGKALDQFRGVEDFSFSGTWELLRLTRDLPDIVHCHNLHGRYFDLRALPWLSRQAPLILTLHDAWLLSGHCAHSLGCERWLTGCGQCPDLSIPPAVRRDATAFNWRRKRDIYSKCRLFVATPSQWLMDRVKRSILAPAILEARVIPNGVDLSSFHPADRQEARARLDISQRAKVILFAANTIRDNYFKDYQTLKAAFDRVAAKSGGQELLFLALGEDAPSERIGQAELRFVPFQNEAETVARYYQAADVYAHAARADTFPNTVLEALACGLPVVATATGGIPEQVEHGQTGFLAPPGDARGMAEHILEILLNDSLRRCQSAQATEAARQRFDLRKQVDSYLDWYRDLFQRGRDRHDEKSRYALSGP